jgi:choice-of-anchor B domain-containing protein
MLRVVICLLFPTVVFGQASKNIELLDHWTADSLLVNSTNVRYNDCWGFVENGREYVVAGSTEGTHFFEITDDNKLRPADFVTGNYSSSLVIHRDFKTFGNYLYSVCDEGLSSLQIIDVSFLPDSVSLVAEYFDEFTQVHTIFIDTLHAMLYACDITPSFGGVLLPQSAMKVYSLANPLLPQLVYTGPNDIPEVHAAYVRNNIAYLNCGFDGLRVYDFSNPSAPIFLQNLSFYQEQGYNHQGWLSPDGTHYVFGDETNGKKLKLCEVENHQLTVKGTFGTNFEENSVSHNIMLTDEFAYVAYYNEGLRVYDLRSIPVKEIAHYDTYPQEEELFTMRGAWGIYRDFPSGRIAISDRVNGLFLFEFDESIFTAKNENDLILFPNPVLQGEEISFRISATDISEFEYTLADMRGKIVASGRVTDRSYANIEALMALGMYTLRVQYADYLGDPVEIHEKIMVY